MAKRQDAAENERAVFGGNSEAAGELKQFIERYERLEEDKAAILDDMKELKAEWKGRGFDSKALMAIIKERKQDHAERQEHEAIVEMYKIALGMV